MAHSGSVSFIPSWLSWLSRSVIALIWLLGVGFPIFTLVLRLKSSEAAGLLFSSEVLTVVAMTMIQALLSTVISAFFGFFLGLWVGESTKRLARWTEAFFEIPFGIPSVVVALSWILWLGRSGVLSQRGWQLDWLYSFKAVLLAHVFLNIPWIALLVAQARRSLPHLSLDAAASLGAGRAQRLCWVIWPQVRWTFLSACTQVFNLCVMSFAIVLILGGGPSVQTLETALYTRLRYGTLDLSGAVAFGIWELVLGLVPWILLLFFESRARELKHSISILGQSARPETSSQSSKKKGIFLFLSGVFLVAPYFLILSPLSSGWKSLWTEWQGQIKPALQVSLQIAGVTGFGAVVIGILGVFAVQSLSRWVRLQGVISTLILVPSALSTMVLGLGVWLAYGRWVDPFSGQFSALAMIVGVQTLLFFPVTFRIFWPLSLKMPTSELEAAMTLGASGFRAFWLLDWPRWRGPCWSAAAMVMAATLGEIGAVSLFYHEDLMTLPLLVSRWMAQYRFEEAQGLAAFLFILSIALVILVSRSHRRVE